VDPESASGRRWRQNLGSGGPSVGIRLEFGEHQTAEDGTSTEQQQSQWMSSHGNQLGNPSALISHTGLVSSDSSSGNFCSDAILPRAQGKNFSRIDGDPVFAADILR
jgi:hypothetical protein